MKPIGQIPSPYGPLIDVFHDPARSPNPDDCFFHTLDDCMTLAGVHGQVNREACRHAFQQSNSKGGVSVDIFMQNGGRTVLYEPLRRPKDSAYQKMPKAGMEIPIENWVSATMDASTWFDRAHILEDIISSFIGAAEGWSGPKELDALVASMACQILMTAALEHLCEKEIDCIQAAAFYSLSGHEEWASAGLNWLMPIKDTWLKDWNAEHPAYTEFARSCRLFTPSLPAWISGDRT